ncbi:MAG: hypothetical protein FWC40_06455 [Proteobacteria bacterium]|nr:hypothetical protein [Pseudomonadota bacterium]
MKPFLPLIILLSATCLLALGCDGIKQKASEIQEQSIKEAKDRVEPMVSSARQKLSEQDRKKLAKNLREMNESLKKIGSTGDCNTLIERFVPQTQKLAAFLNAMDTETMEAHQDALVEHFIQLGLIIIKCECGYMFRRFYPQAIEVGEKLKASQGELQESHIYVALTLVACQNYPGVKEARKIFSDKNLPVLIKIIDKAADAFAKMDK